MAQTVRVTRRPITRQWRSLCSMRLSRETRDAVRVQVTGVLFRLALG